MHDMLPLLRATAFPPLRRRGVATLQVNLGYRCNQSCLHCHVNAGPGRTEQMDETNIALIPRVLAARGIPTLNLTGGAPELHPCFRCLVEAARRLGARVIDRCNLTILSEPGFKDLSEFLAEQGVEVVASLPCYLEENVKRQRGRGVYARSIAGLQRLNALGYGQPGMRLLKDNFCPDNLEQVMCRDLISVDWQGHLYDCDFNQQLGLPLGPPTSRWPGGPTSPKRHLSDLLTEDFSGASIAVADHCYGCTAGQGSSCGGALDVPLALTPPNPPIAKVARPQPFISRSRAREEIGAGILPGWNHSPIRSARHEKVGIAGPHRRPGRRLLRPRPGALPDPGCLQGRPGDLRRLVRRLAPGWWRAPISSSTSP